MSELLRYDTAPRRRSAILASLRATGFVSVAELTEALGVSDMTIRRDLRKLERDDQVRVVRGGVSLPLGSLHAPAFSSRAARAGSAKGRIAAAAVGLIEAGETVAVDAGTTTFAFAEQLPVTLAGTVVTNSVPVIQLLLAREAPRIVGLGGEIVVESQAFAGPMTVEAAAGLRATTYVMGAAAVDERGIYVSTDLERPTKRAMRDMASRVLLLVDHTKFQASAPVLLCSFAEIDVLVTDRRPPAAVATALREAGVEVVLPAARE